MSEAPKFRMCACMGPQRGDPYCYCEMERRGLTPTPWSDEEKARLNAALSKMFKLNKENGKDPSDN